MRRPDVSAWLDDCPVVGDWDRTTRLVVAVAVGALLARLFLLGARVAHYDEGRVAWWTLHFLETGQFEYRYIIHGPFVQHVTRVVFAVFGTSDFAMRLVVAVVGALLPVSVLLFREHLRGDEMVAAAFFLAFNPVLLYYSRFFRSSLLVAAFAFVAFGFLVRAADERSLRYVHGTAVFLALAFAAKENAAVYLLVWVGATALLVDHALFRTGGTESGADWLIDRIDAHRDRVDRYRASVGRYLGHTALAAGLFVAVALFFYAPRAPGVGAVGLWDAVTNPSRFPALVDATLADVVDGYNYWFGGTTDPGCRKENVIAGYLCFLGRTVETLVSYAMALVVLSAFGFLLERWGRSDSRNLVLFTGYWGFVSVLGYPLGTDIYGAWITVNALVPLAVPAGVGLALLVRWALDVERDRLRAGVATFVVALMVGQMALSAVGGVYLNPSAEGNELVQYAQPADDFRPSLDVLDERATAHEGPDALFVGSQYVRDAERTGGITPRCSSISETLPLQWYLARVDATGDCVDAVGPAVERIRETTPLVVFVPADDSDKLVPHLDGYSVSTYRLRTTGAEVAILVDRNATG